MIYLDNAATSWPKPPGVYQEMENCLLDYCANPGRSGHSMALKAEEMVFRCREQISKFFCMDNPSNVIFTLNATMALNIVIKGILDTGKHAIVTSMEHNSVLRPLAVCGAEYDMVVGDLFGYVNADDVEACIKKNTSLIICTLSSNVCGSVQPFDKIAEIAHKHNIPFLLDASQGAGTIKIDMKAMHIDFLVAPGHKGLLGPVGTGILCINSTVPVKTLFEGGTGSQSKLLQQPDFYPDRLESGTLNVVGIAGLLKGIEYINDVGINQIYSYEKSLADTMAAKLNSISGVRLVGYDQLRPRTAVVSFVIEGLDCLVASSGLNYDFGIALRAGYHCAYSAHSTLGTGDCGTLRLSFGPFNTFDDVQQTFEAVKKIALQTNRKDV